MIMDRFEQATFTEIAVTSVVNLVLLSLNLFIFAILIRVILSWISPGGYNPIVAIIHSITNPVLRPFQRFLPPMGGLDLSPLVVIVLLQLARMLVVAPLRDLAGLPGMNGRVRHGNSLKSQTMIMSLFTIMRPMM